MDRPSVATLQPSSLTWNHCPAFLEYGREVRHRRTCAMAMFLASSSPVSRTRSSPLTKPDPHVLTKTDPASARQLAGKGVKGSWNKWRGPAQRGGIRLCRESPLTPWTADMLPATAGDEGFCHPRRLPHGECGVRGSAPRFGGSVHCLAGGKGDHEGFLLLRASASGSTKSQAAQMGHPDSSGLMVFPLAEIALGCIAVQGNNVGSNLQLVEIISPQLHHRFPCRQKLRPVVC